MSRYVFFTARRRLYASLIVISIAAGAFAFQNCSGTNNQNSNLSSIGQINKALSTKPNPVDLSINQISYMSCPANNTFVNAADPLAQAFYRFRFGAYDNSSANGFAGNTSVAGMSLNTNGMNYLKTIAASPNAAMIANYITSSPYTAASQPVAAIIHKARSTQSLTSTIAASSILAPFTDAAMISNISNSGTNKVNYVQELGSVQGAFVGNLDQGANGITENQLRIGMGSDLLFIGMSATNSLGDPGTTIQNLQGPDSNPAQRLFGTGYSLGYSNNLISTVNEISLETSASGTSINTSAVWDCFSLNVVREVDRTYTTVGAPVTYNSPLKGGAPVTLSANDVVYPGEENLIPGATARTYNYINGNQAAVVANLNARYATAPGVVPKSANNFASCPTENSSALSGVAADRMRIIRRFLPPSNWEVNMTSGCIVPTSSAIGTGGACYASETNPASLIDYVGTPGTNCRIDPTDTTKIDCSARVSFCWKKQ